MISLRDALTAAAGRLAGAGIEGARAEARLLLCHVMVDPGDILRAPERPLSADEAAAFETLVARRAAREPASHLLGRREFWSLEFRVGPAVLDPRPDSEALIEAVLAARPDRTKDWRIADLGSGSGCLLLTLLREYPRATGIGVDRSRAAASVAVANARDLGLADRARMAVGDWWGPLGGRFDIVVSNPPYIASAEIEDLEPEIRLHEPSVALDGGPDGLDCYRAILPATPDHLAPGGLLALEIGAGQGEVVTRIAAAAGLRAAGVRADLAGRQRCLLFEVDPSGG
ncbi:peptide chain release factor N(5)-glutamine methyltransferase [Oceanibacterium hippocampi]|uniref:Release factor glutamine methyltransferase n=1 Tax=Oceanibacterium hippocampi TaxID=745714 RepID=A0A1Y5RA15_9PROT|nr:peptide chain release factor N(5)-glutamine methyltransferase [Oceanibacterium hippocampi]SLN09924.1 Release factor glutamine methyltransferase [Oceanibacterium hippocampi]